MLTVSTAVVQIIPLHYHQYCNYVVSSWAPYFEHRWNFSTLSAFSCEQHCNVTYQCASKGNRFLNDSSPQFAYNFAEVFNEFMMIDVRMSAIWPYCHCSWFTLPELPPKSPSCTWQPIGKQNAGIFSVFGRSLTFPEVVRTQYRLSFQLHITICRPIPTTTTG